MLTIVEGRVIGCLLEKERTVPEQYPLSANALVAACNQSTAREPVMHVDEHEVLTALDSLKAGGLVRFVHPSHGRSVTRYRQVFVEHHGLEPPGAALLCVLLLRGPQTAAELHARSSRLYELGSAADAEAALHSLARSELVRLIDRQPGQSAPTLAAARRRRGRVRAPCRGGVVVRRRRRRPGRSMSPSSRPASPTWKPPSPTSCSSSVERVGL